MQGSVQRERPTGVTILAILAILAGLFFLLLAFLAFAGGALLAGTGETGSGAAGGLLGLVGLVPLVLAVLYLAFGFGAWTLKPWAWMLGVVSQVISLIFSVLAIVTRGDFTGQIVPILISAAILFYLFQPTVKAAFGRA